MHLTSLSIPVHDLKFADYFQAVLGLRVETPWDTAQIHLGTTTLELQVDPSTDEGTHHLAFTIPTGKFAAAKNWLAERAELIVNADGQDEFEGPAAWNSRSVYFEGPERSVLELIERRDLSNATDGAFSPADLLCISEVGVAVPDVLSAAQALKKVAGIDSYGNAPSATFGAVGDVHGLLILVSDGRSWFPTTDRHAHPCAIRVNATGHPGLHQLGESVLELHSK